MRYIALIVVTIALSVAFTTSARAAEHAGAPVRYVQSDVLLARAAPNANAVVLQRFAINAPLELTGREDDGFAEVSIDQGQYGTKPEAKTAWVARRFLGARRVSKEAIRTSLAVALAVENSKEALKWAERFAAMSGRSPESLSFLAQAAALAGNDAWVTRLHEEAESGRTLVAGCDGGQYVLLGELFADGRFAPSIVRFADDDADGAKSQRERRRLEALLREASVRAFFAPNHDGRNAGDGFRFSAAQLLGMESSGADDESALTYGLKIRLGPCNMGSTFVATRALAISQFDVSGGMKAEHEGVPAHVARKLVVDAASSVTNPLREITVEALPGDTRIPNVPARYERSVVVADVNAREFALRTTWSLHNDDAKTLLQFDFHAQSMRPYYRWVIGNDNAVLRLLPWGKPGQGGFNLVIVDANGKARRLELPTMLVTGC